MLRVGVGLQFLNRSVTEGLGEKVTFAQRRLDRGRKVWRLTIGG